VSGRPFRNPRFRDEARELQGRIHRVSEKAYLMPSPDVLEGPDALEGAGSLEEKNGEKNYRFTSFMIARF